MIIKREKETGSLRQAYDRMCQEEKFQLRFISGEAGTGKTVLANMFMEEAMREEPAQTLFVTTYCSIRSEYNIPYQPFKELLKNLLQDVKEEEENHIKNDRSLQLKESIKFCARMLIEHAPDLVGNFVPGISLVSAIGQSLLKEEEKYNVEESKILEQYVDAIRAIASRYKLVLLIDDLQWIDRSSVNLLYQLIMGLTNSPVMIMGCYRSTDIDIAVNGEKHPLARLITEVKISQGNVFINLDQIPVNDRRDFMNRMLDIEKNVYDSRFREKLFERTGGNPLFISELVSLMKEQGMIVRNYDDVWMNNANLHWSAYPVRIEGIIQERIGRLEDSLVEILSHASVQGYSFIAQVLSKTMGAPERDLLMTLSRTLQKQHHLVYEGDCVRSSRGIVSNFNFSNYIFQQYLYQELSQTQRMLLHSDIAGILEEYFRDNIEEASGDIARHYELSGEYEKAIPYIRITVSSMIRISAYEEAAVLIKKALSFLEEMPGIPENKNEILFFMVQLCICYRSTKGWGSPEVEEIYLKAKRLSKELENYDYIDVILFGVWSIHLSKLELERSLEMSCKNIQAGRKHHSETVLLQALVSLANTLYWMGRFDEVAGACNEYWKEKPEGMKNTDTVELNDLFIKTFRLLAARQKDDRELVDELYSGICSLTDKNNNHFYQAVVYQALSWYHFVNNDREELGLYAKKMMELTEKYQFLFYLGTAKIFYGDYLSKTGHSDAGQLIQQGYNELCDVSRAHPCLMHSLYGLALSRHYLRTQQDKEFVSCVEQVMDVIVKTNEVCYLDEFYLLQYDYFTRKGNREEADEALRKAGEAATNNGATVNMDKIKLINNSLRL